jgi:Holliday junction DNA helicase RuvB
MHHLPGSHYAVRALVGEMHHGRRATAVPRPRVPLPPKDDGGRQATASSTGDALGPVEPMQRSADPLRPGSLATMIGQERLKPLLRRIVDGSKRSGRPLDHVMLVGASGTGKSTLALALANEIGTRVFQAKPPVSLTMFERLREVMRDGDVLYIDEIHLQVTGDRRGAGQSPDPETFYHVMEDHRLITMNGPIDFPHITVIGATTDSGLLPEPFLGRFGLSLQLDRYTAEEMALMALLSGRTLGLKLAPEAAYTFADAARSNPRVVNRYVRNASALSPEGGEVGVTEAQEVVIDLNGTTLDGLTQGMVAMLRYLLTQSRTVRGEVVYQAGVQSISTALGHSRDTKAVALYVEPYLIERGLLQVMPNGRRLTEAGVERALAL